MRTYLSLEELARRDNPSVSFDPSTGVVTVVGTAGNDSVNVRYDFTRPPYYQVLHYADGKLVDDVILDWTKVKFVVCNLAGGNDVFFNALSTDCVVFGGDGNDTLVGGDEASAWLFGNAGNDVLVAANADFTLKPSYLDGGSGADVYQCNFSPDVIFGFNAAEGDVVRSFNPLADRFV